MTLVVGKNRALLVDTGMGIGDAKKAIQKITDLPLWVVNTHGHIDHIAGNYQFSEVYMSEADINIAKEALDEKKKRHILENGITPPKGFDIDAYMSYKADNVIPLKHEQVFDLGGITVEAISVPTHSPGSTCFFVKELGLLLTGDCIAPIVYLLFEESCTIGEHIQMLAEASKLPFSHFFSSHNEELISKDKLKLYINCAEAINLEDSSRYKNPLFPENPGKLFTFRNPKDKNDYAAIVYAPDKLIEKK